jgi:crotonobetainyl-CoA:carnitine CoA-transferase CaiB-like acyl-CoA transferase
MLLKGIRVLDLTRLLPGPFCTMILADFGAEVIKVEEPGKGDYIRELPPLLNGVGTCHLVVNRGKKSLTLNLKTPEGEKIFLNLTRQADVVVEGFRPGVMERLGLGYETLRKENPRLIYCAITGYGQDGPCREQVGHDINYISTAGLMDNTGLSDGPPVIPGVQIADLGGAMMALAGILMALFGRERTNRGQMIDISMTDAAFLLGINAASQYAMLRKNPLRGGERLTGGNVCYQVYRTKDGRFISIGALEEKFWSNLCCALSREDLIDELDAPAERQKELIRIFQGIFATRTLAEWIEILEPADTCWAPVLTLEETFRHPQLQSRKMILPGEHPSFGMLQQLGIPIKMSGTPGEVSFCAPEIGEHTYEILTKMGYDPQSLENLRNKGII